MFDRILLRQDLVDARGGTLAPAGFVVSPEAIEAAAAAAVPAPRVPLDRTPHREELASVLEDPTYRHLFDGDGVAGAVERALLEVGLPPILFEELTAVREVAPALYRHGLATGAIAARMLLAAVGDGRGVPELAAAGLLHDLGMRHLPARLLRQRDRLSRAEVAEVAHHPLTGAFHLATVLGRHPAVAAAHAHHWRCGQGYPHLPGPPTRSIEVVSVASAFAALTQPRAFRSEPFDARAAADVLVAEARAGTADGNTVKLLVHALRGGRGDPRGLQFGSSRGGQVPEVNRHMPVAPPRGSLL